MNATETRKLSVVGLGELLWDELPGGARLGGAPANFAVTAARLGAHGILASRLGRDERGSAARTTLQNLPVDTNYLQVDPALPTGRVSVTLSDGQPEYIIHQPVAWDALALTPEWINLADRADAICWGSLSQRSIASRETIEGFLSAACEDCVRIFDVNLRQKFATADIVRHSLAQATVLKLNDGEMPALLRLAGLPPATQYDPADDAARAQALEHDAHHILSAHFALDLVAITLGAHGSLLVERHETIRHRGVPTRVIDTVGAGDAFTAALTVHRLQGASLSVQSEAANRWGSWVASQSGAMPTLLDTTRTKLEREIRKAAR